jgi:hypothetical protein
VYEAITIMAKRANQINSEIKKNWLKNWKSLLHIMIVLKKFWNKEQIEVSKFYENASKATCFSSSRMVR